jgi:hypothetical protein
MWFKDKKEHCIITRKPPPSATKCCSCNGPTSDSISQLTWEMAGPAQCPAATWALGGGCLALLCGPCVTMSNTMGLP